MGSICCKEEPVDLLSDVELSHFILLRSVGRGAFGKVRLVQHKGTKKLYALKYINKEKCIQMRAVENILSERRLLEQIDFSLIVNLRYAFQDDENLFMVLDLMLGGDLRFHLDRLGALPEEHVQFYAAQIALSLNYLHSRNIIHRDLKPDNILLDEKGHAHLTDFNIAVRLSRQRKKPLMSVAGSLAYISPEILQKQGYTYSVDWWSLGIVIYELLYGKRPFGGKTNHDLQRAILCDPIEFPKEPKVSAHGINFMKELLTRDVSIRLGVGESGFKKLQKHPWLKHICWDILASKTIGAPFVPDEKKSNFDPTHELEEVLLQETPPLKMNNNNNRKKQQAVKRSLSNEFVNSNNQLDVSAYALDYPERYILEEKFLPYDFTKPDNKDAKQQQQTKKKERSSTDESIGLLQPSKPPPVHPTPQ